MFSKSIDVPCAYTAWLFTQLQKTFINYTVSQKHQRHYSFITLPMLADFHNSSTNGLSKKFEFNGERISQSHKRIISWVFLTHSVYTPWVVCICDKQKTGSCLWACWTNSRQRKTFDSYFSATATSKSAPFYAIRTETVKVYCLKQVRYLHVIFGKLGCRFQVCNPIARNLMIGVLFPSYAVILVVIIILQNCSRELQCLK